MDAGLKEVYEDNIVGSAADVGKKGDFYTVLAASLGGNRRIGEGTFLFLRATAEGYLYRRYPDLNATIAGLNGGVYKEFNHVLSAAGSLNIKRENFKDSQRSSNAYGGLLNLRQQAQSDLWIKEGYEFTKNKADSSTFSYEAHLLWVGIGYSIMPKTTATVGYSYLRRTYEEPAGYRNIFHSLSLGLTKEIAEKISVYGNYDRQYISSNHHAATHINNVFTLGLSYSY
jgi:predicted porin